MKPFRGIVFFCCIGLLFSCGTIKKTPTEMLPVFDKQGHRGCRGLMPENTIPAMIKAIDLGVTTIELDVVFTKDKVALVSHEPFFNHEITTKPDGGFIAENEERKYNIYQMSFAETQQYDVGIKPNPRFPRQQKIRATKPSLASLIDSVELYLAIQNLPKVFYNIETKCNPATDNIFHPAPQEFVDSLMSVIRKKEISSRVIIQSFDYRTLKLVHSQYPQVKTALLVEAFDKSSLQEQLDRLGFQPTIYSPAFSLVNSALADACRDKKMKLVPWTVNEASTLKQLKELGIDGAISDFPDIFNN
jgi:glycerophosphoryl diester phosphodiesterase